MPSPEQVVVSTCAGAGEARLDPLRFRVVVLDEASQATEPSSLVPLVRGAQSVVMAGDQRQLPPTVLSQQAAR
jgi:regulator of nonsense transcripts 1